MVLAADDEDIVIVLFLDADVVIRIFGVPQQCLFN
jgi:hypothetical protein